MHSGKRVLLVDADLRRPGLTNMLGLRGPQGLSHVLRDTTTEIESSVRENLHHDLCDGLDVLASGARPSNPAELLHSPRFADLLAWAETVYDQILIDSPPTLAAADTTIIGRQVDGAVLVVRPDKNQRRPVMRAVDGFRALDVNLLGVVVNRVGEDGTSDYYGYGMGYGYGYGAGYGAEHDEPHGEDAPRHEPNNDR